MLWSSWCSRLRAEDLPVLCSLDISKLPFLITKDSKKNFRFFLQFLVIKTLDPDPDSLEMLDPYPESMNPDPQLWFLGKHRFSVQEKFVPDPD